MNSLILTSLSFLVAFQFLTAAVDTDVDPAAVAALLTIPQGLDRFQYLPKASNWMYDFNTNPKDTFSPGGVAIANRATFPAMTGTGLTISLLSLGPCSMLPFHLHRGFNAVTAFAGTTDTYMVQENGAPLIHTTLTPGQMTIFPQASIHAMVNNGCTNAQLLSAISMEDAGTLNVFNAVFQPALRALVQRLTGDQCDFNATMANLPPFGTGSNTGTAECLHRCGIAAPKIRIT